MKLHILWGTLFTILVCACGLFYYQYTKDISTLTKLLSERSTTLSNLETNTQSQIGELTQVLIDIQQGTAVETEALERLVAQQESEFLSKLSEIEQKKDITEQLLTNTNQDLAQNIESLTDKIFSLQKNSKEEIVRKWDDITVRLECRYETSERSFGSGLYIGPNSILNLGAGNEHSIMTNSHVLEENGEIPTDCDITWGTGAEVTIIFDENDGFERTSFFEGFDAAFITLNQDEVIGIGVDETVQYNLCTVSPQSGEEILILGYPRIGSTDSITSTEGIISGYDGGFFITSAKISKGNSGGAAISIKNDCYFGIPTLVRADEVESLGRILDIITIFK